MHTYSYTAFDLRFVLCFLQTFKLVWMRYIRVFPNESLRKPHTHTKVRIWAASSRGLSLTSPPPPSLPSLLHQFIQAWSDTCASEVSAAIKMLPLHCFNWNLCCWCVNSCWMEKGRFIIFALHRLPKVRCQQSLHWKAPVYLWFLILHFFLHTVTSAYSRAAVKWLRKECTCGGVMGWRGRVKWPARIHL